MNAPEDTLDLMRDEFQRIIANPDSTPEIKGLCVRAISEILVRVPIIKERDRLERELGKTKIKLEDALRKISTITENKGDDETSNLEKLVRQSLLDWIAAGSGDECFWEHWDECPTEIELTPNMVWGFLEAETGRFQRQVNAARAKLSERKTVHEWLNELGAADKEENGKPMCLLRRLAVQLGIQPYSVK